MDRNGITLLRSSDVDKDDTTGAVRAQIEMVPGETLVTSLTLLTRCLMCVVYVLTVCFPLLLLLLSALLVSDMGDAPFSQWGVGGGEHLC